MVWETGVQSQVESYQRLKKWYLMPSCLTLSIIRYGSRVKRSNPGNGVAPSPTLWCSSYRKESFRIALNYSRQLFYPSKVHCQKEVAVIQILILSCLQDLIKSNGVRHLSKKKKRGCSGLNLTAFDSEAQVLEMWKVMSNPLFPYIPRCTLFEFYLHTYRWILTNNEEHTYI